MTVPDEERRPIPLDAVRREYREILRGQGIDPDTVDFKVEHARYIGMFGGQMKAITTTILMLPDGSSYQWFPILPDGLKRRSES
jgi:hypothetical protein